MTVGKRRRSDRSGREKLPSPGRPSVARAGEPQRFWAAIASGKSSEDAALVAGVSPAVGTRWFREAGGMPPSHLTPSSKPRSGRFLCFAEREELAIFHAQGHGVREIARGLVEPHRRSHESYGETQPHGAAGSSTGPRRPSGTRIGRLAGPSLPSWR